jgi:hypothetical protein
MGNLVRWAQAEAMLQQQQANVIALRYFDSLNYLNV